MYLKKIFKVQLIFKKKYYDDKHMSPPEFKVGSKVQLIRNDLINNKKGKLSPKKSSPFTILKFQR